ncbi:hypothetical protein [Aeromicrobium duanguangcaii]|uniref:Uncharacterized protein n=1 Tax=Aeromicrobium duanguangcaii TaxID=2968086 RepID=A0ABY5KEG3_9ACTN|nr:hypothetical protein [Aeromicrobium duanguangcaii]MCD9154760.1 hypothetical protein [Aeromicrobium duanguangcaii]UUI67826.1 hypothetical protein NP095_11535 [Aeromicrobium duanguangcaii]
MATASDLIRALARGRVTLSGSERLDFLATIDDRVLEVVGGGPQGLLDARLGRVSLNPQPLPPADAGRLLLDAMARGIIIVSGRGEGAQQAFMEDIEDWCGTGWPRRWPRPKPGPLPDPRQELDPSVLLGGALAAAEWAAAYPEGEMQDLFEKAADQLTEAALR